MFPQRGWPTFLIPRRANTVMARPTLAERLSALDQPDHATDASAMWSSVRPLLVLGRIVMVGVIIIVGIPLFLLISTVITYIDRLVRGEEETSA